ncbi:hypothetical protein SmJEL517_g02144 [Synchytrium microbalum]|uniref:Golgi apparatus membrane protein TVP23 n=1 Tax=Synchytrium microbalum TaxID=1806994 RepID=A0A507CCA2_9FUNG|nr:uncharacterized protein SmJEL517_g02144 [Synchytrium microbalum]TPX35574.1 hypothetical protein SmJEL517_g02144 [Synchytrium microbalum]
MGDRQGLLSSAAPMGTSNNNNNSLLDGNLQTAQQPLQPQASILQLSSHPTALVFHMLFRTAAILYYTFEWLFSVNFILSFVIIVLLLAFDFWTVKNVTGRLLVGLRWWNEIKDDGSNVWIFESRENRQVNAVDSRIFWSSLYATGAIWIVFALLCVMKFNVTWLLVTVIASFLNGANLSGYWRCEKDAKQKMSDFASNSVVQGAIGNFITSRFTNMFAGSPGGPPGSNTGVRPNMAV